MKIIKGKLLYVLCLVSIATFVFQCPFVYLEAFLNGRDAILQNKQEVQIHVLTNYPLMTEKPWNEAQAESNKTTLWQRQEEIEETLQRNLGHPLVTSVHLLVNQPSAKHRLHELNFHNKHKIFLHQINAMPTFRDFFNYINDRLKNQVVLVTNMDVYVGEGFEQLNKIFLIKENVAYVLTRNGRQEQRCNMIGIRGYCETGYTGSHDTFIFVLTQRLQESILSELDYELYHFGSENRLLWVFRFMLKKRLLNPCKYLRTYHNHCIDIRDSKRQRIDKGKHLRAPPSGLYG